MSEGGSERASELLVLSYSTLAYTMEKLLDKTRYHLLDAFAYDYDRDRCTDKSYANASKNVLGNHHQHHYLPGLRV